MDFSVYDLKSEFTLREVAMLWCEVELMDKSNRPRVLIVFGELLEAAEGGVLPVKRATWSRGGGRRWATGGWVPLQTGTDWDLGLAGGASRHSGRWVPVPLQTGTDWDRTTVDREDLSTWAARLCAERNIQKPKFLFRDERPSQVLDRSRRLIARQGGGSGGVSAQAAETINDESATARQTSEKPASREALIRPATTGEANEQQRSAAILSHVSHAELREEADRLFLATAPPWKSIAAAARKIAPLVKLKKVSRPLSTDNAVRTVTEWLRYLVATNSEAFGKLTPEAQARLKKPR